ncbi:MAG: ABC transporter ATP-binding protein [Acidobacteria bacterium]|nr:ABC transporter ATP-binding protein [Acidobacteriota bacterium]
MSAAAQTVTVQPAPPRVSAWKHLLGLLPYLGRYKGRITLGLLVLGGMGAVGNLVPLVIGALVDSLSGNPLPSVFSSGITRPLLSPLIPFYHPSSARTLVVFCLALLAIMVLKGVLSFWTRWTLIGVSRDIEYDLRNDLLVKLVQMEPEFYVRNRTGELMSRCTNDLNAVRMVLGPGIMYSATTIVTMVLAIALMLKLSPVLTLWVLLPVPVVAIAVGHFGKIIHDLYEKIQASLAALSARAQENLAGVRVVRAYRQEEAEMRGFDAPNREYVARNMKLIATWSMFMPSLTALIGTTFLIVLWQGGSQVMRGSISLGTLMAFYTYLGLLIWPMVALGWVTNMFQRGAASMGRMNYVLNAQPSINDAEARGTDGAQIRGEIQFRHLTFAYPTTRSANGAGPGGEPGGPVLRDINLDVPAGSTLAIVGPTGSGKTTLAALVARLWEAPPGTVLLDGRFIREWPLATLRRAIGFVPQDTFLFSETVKENIAFGVEDAPAEQVTEAARMASLYGDISGFPAQFETLVGERGITLSGGQKQRTALARAVIREPRILILDDALSSVDTDTEEKILRHLKDVVRERTTILISHRCSTVRHADQIVVLRDGRIVERGTHDELLALGGYYNDLYQKQLLEEELERA